jgi:hypothetical protein
MAISAEVCYAKEQLGKSNPSACGCRHRWLGLVDDEGAAILGETREAGNYTGVPAPRQQPAMASYGGQEGFPRRHVRTAQLSGAARGTGAK